jgi:hypothetical protein
MSEFLKEKLGKMYDLLPSEDAGKYEKTPDISTGDMIARDQELAREKPKVNKVDLPKFSVPFAGEIDTNKLRDPYVAPLAGGLFGAGLGMLGAKNLQPPGVPEARVSLNTIRGEMPALLADAAAKRRAFETERRMLEQQFGPTFYEDFQARKNFEQGYGQPPRSASEIAAQGKLNVAGGTSRGNVQGFNQTTGGMAEGVRTAAGEAPRGSFTGTTQSSNPLFVTTPVADEIAARRQIEMRSRGAGEKTLERMHNEQLAAQVALEEARLDRAKKAGALKALLPSVPERIGYAQSSFPKLTGALSGAGTLLSVTDALTRYEQGDRSGAVLASLSAAFGGMASIPAAKDPRVLTAKGIGVLGGLGMIPVEMAHDYAKPKIMKMLERAGYSPSVMDDYQR